MRFGLLFTTLVMFQSVVDAGDWPEFRGPSGMGLSEAKNLPLRWSETDNVAWRIEVEGKGWSSPILLGDRIYLTSAIPTGEGGDQSGQSLNVMCIRASNGQLLWNRPLFRQRRMRIHTKNSHASPTPITDGEYVYLHFGTNGTACVDLNGKVIWKNQRLRYQMVHGTGGSPVLVNDLLVVSCDGGDTQFVVALDKKSGKVRWRTPRPRSSGKRFAFSTPLAIEVAGRTQVVSAGANHVAAYNPGNGREIWRVFHGGYSVVPRPVFDGSNVFISSGYDRPVVLAINPSGTGDISNTGIRWKTSSNAPRNASMLLVDGNLFFVSDRGIASCVDATTGDVHWDKRLGGNYSASPVYSEGKIYFQNEQGEGVVIRAADRYQEIARNSLNEETLASYAVTDGALFIRTRQRLYRIEEN